MRGWVRLAPYSPDAEVLRSARRWWLVGVAGLEEATPVEVIGVRRHGAGLVARWRGCDDPEAAERSKGLRVAVARADFPALPGGQHYWVDLVGLRVVNRSGQVLGKVTGLRASGAHDLLEIEGQGGGALVLVPVVDRYIDEVDAGAGTIRVDWDPQWLA